MRKLVGILGVAALKVACDSVSSDALNFAVSILKVNGQLVFPCVLTGAVVIRQRFLPMACSGAHKDQFVQSRRWSFADHKENIAEEVAPYHNREAH